MKTKTLTALATFTTLFILTANTPAQMPPGYSGGGTNNSYGTNAYNFYPGFNPTPTFIYPTNATLKWSLSNLGFPRSASMSLSPDGNLYAPYYNGPGNSGIFSIKMSQVDTNDALYPLPDDFINWVFEANGVITMSPSILLDDSVCVLGNFGVSNKVILPKPTEYPLPPNVSFVSGIVGVNSTNGSIAWAFCNDSYHLFSAITVAANGTICATSGGYVYAFTNAAATNSTFTNALGYITTLNNMAVKWIYNDGGEFANTFQYSSIFAGADGTIYVFAAYYSGLIYAFNPTNGALKWKSKPIIQSSLQYSDAPPYVPAIGNDGGIYIGGGTNFFAIDVNAPVTNGTLGFKWIFKNTKSGAFESKPVIGVDGTIYVEYGRHAVGGTNEVLALDSKTGVLKWRKEIGIGNATSGGSHGAIAIASDGQIYVADTDDTMYSLDQSGNINWSYSTGAGYGLTSPLIAPDGTILVEDANGSIYAFEGAAPIACSAWPEAGRNARRTSAMATASTSSPRFVTNGFQVAISGVSNMPVCQCVSSDLITWTNIGQAILTGGTTNFVDIGATNYPYRFYRAFPQ